jgi:23S rRNA pseudouridine1911/1915/1917 synthase
VVDKPAFVAAHPSLGWDGPSVTGHLAAAGCRISTSGPPERQGVVQRLDVGTSGLMVVAKSEPAYSALKQAFRARTVRKTYRALVQGYPDPLAGTIDAAIGHARSDQWKMALRADGRAAVTHYRTLEVRRAASLLEVELETGRTHQIRVHLAGLRHPCVGDRLYGGDPALARRLGLERQWLHSAALGLAHPIDGRPLAFASPDPPDLARALELVRRD